MKRLIEEISMGLAPFHSEWLQDLFFTPAVFISTLFGLRKISATDLLLRYEFCFHKALETNPILVEVGSEGNAFDGSPSPIASSRTL